MERPRGIGRLRRTVGTYPHPSHSMVGPECAMLTVRPSEMLQHVPGRTWLDPIDQDGDDMSVRGFNFTPSTANIWTASHVVIVYRQAHATMKRSIDGHL